MSLHKGEEEGERRLINSKYKIISHWGKNKQNLGIITMQQKMERDLQ